MKLREREMQKEKEKERLHLENIKKQKTIIPPARVRHDKSEQLGKTLDINIDKVELIIGGRQLLQDTTLQISYGRKYGLIGKNGIGKTWWVGSLCNTVA